MRGAGGIFALCALCAATNHAATPPPPGPAASAAGQQVRAGDVLIEGKLYSPSALFILTRPTESFAPDAVLPHALDAAPATTFGASRLRSTPAAPAATQTPPVAPRPAAADGSTSR